MKSRYLWRRRLGVTAVFAFLWFGVIAHNFIPDFMRLIFTDAAQAFGFALTGVLMIAVCYWLSTKVVKS